MCTNQTHYTFIIAVIIINKASSGYMNPKLRVNPFIMKSLDRKALSIRTSRISDRLMTDHSIKQFRTNGLRSWTNSEPGVDRSHRRRTGLWPTKDSNSGSIRLTAPSTSTSADHFNRCLAASCLSGYYRSIEQICRLEHALDSITSIFHNNY